MGERDCRQSPEQTWEAGLGVREGTGKAMAVLRRTLLPSALPPTTQKQIYLSGKSSEAVCVELHGQEAEVSISDGAAFSNNRALSPLV